MATGEDEAQPVVGHGSGRFRGGCPEQLVASGITAYLVDGSVSCRDGDPAARVRGYAVGRPAPYGDRERVLDRVFGQFDVAEHRDQGSDGPAGFRAEDPADRLAVDHHGR